MAKIKRVRGLVKENKKVSERLISQNRINGLRFQIGGLYTLRANQGVVIDSLNDKYKSFPQIQNALDEAAKAELEIQIIKANRVYDGLNKKVAEKEGKLSSWIAKNKSVTSTRIR